MTPDKKCMSPGCDGVVYAKSLCRRHYTKSRQTEHAFDVELMGPVRFRVVVKTRGPNDDRQAFETAYDIVCTRILGLGDEVRMKGFSVRVANEETA